MINIIEEAKKVFDIEIENLKKIKDNIDGDFEVLIDKIINCQGRIIITGMGKSGHIGRKIAATMSSLGTPSFFIHPSEAAHGDLGMITSKDIVLAISNSGETEEIIQLIPSIRKIQAEIVSITCNIDSTLARHSDLNIHLEIDKEACKFGIAPTTSSTATLVFGDALAVVLSILSGFNKQKFGIYHPNGSIGKKLLIKVSDLMNKENNNPTVNQNDTIKRAILEITDKALGAVNVIDSNGKLVGLVTAGDLIRKIEKDTNFINEKLTTIMTTNPIVVDSSMLAIDALNLMKNRKKPLVVLPVVSKEQKCLGLITMNDIVKAGIF